VRGHGILMIKQEGCAGSDPHLILDLVSQDHDRCKEVLCHRCRTIFLGLVRSQAHQDNAEILSCSQAAYSLICAGAASSALF
jgi:hypothetical protein